MLYVPPPLWALICLAAGYGLSIVPGFDTPLPAPTRPVGVIVIGAAMALLIAAMAQFRSAKTQLLPRSPANNALVTGGVYAFTRNPMYLALVLLCLGGALWMQRWAMGSAPLLMFAVANWVFIPFEEAKMRRQFGEQFNAYTRRVRRWL